jgi:hypothetical protein
VAEAGGGAAVPPPHCVSWVVVQFLIVCSPLSSQRAQSSHEAALCPENFPAAHGVQPASTTLPRSPVGPQHSAPSRCVVSMA